MLNSDGVVDVVKERDKENATEFVPLLLCELVTVSESELRFVSERVA